MGKSHVIGGEPITRDLPEKHYWRNVGVLLGTPVPNPSGITGVMLCYVLFYWADLFKIIYFQLQ